MSKSRSLALGFTQVLGLGAVLGFGALAHADQVVLTDGQVVEGVVTVRGDTVEVRIDSGTIGFERAQVKEIKKGASPIEELALRKRQLARTDVAGLRTTALWAEAHGLATEARTLWREVLAMAPDDAAAREHLGYRRVGDAWLTEEEQLERQGLVRSGGVWKTPAEVKAAEEEAALRRAKRDVEPQRPARAPEAQSAEAEEGEEGQGVLQTSTLPPGYPPYGPYYRKVRPYYLDPNAVYGRVQRPAKPQLEKRPPTPIQQPTPKLPQPTKPGPTMRVK